jgi:thioredoxin reductase (NADPH)
MSDDFHTTTPSSYDLVIIGGGPTGINCGIAAGKAGLNYVILEKGVLVNSIYHFPVNMTFFSTSKLLEIGDTPFISHGEKPTRREALEYYRRLREHFDLHVRLYEPVERMERLDDGRYRVVSERGEYRAHSVVVATGFYDTPNRMGVPGEDLPKVRHYYDDAGGTKTSKFFIENTRDHGEVIVRQVQRKLEKELV